MELPRQVSGDADCEVRGRSFTRFGNRDGLAAAADVFGVTQRCSSALKSLARGSWQLLEAFFPDQSINGV
jgi:hypothetical protein